MKRRWVLLSGLMVLTLLVSSIGMIGCSSSDSSKEPVISNLTITPNPVALGRGVQVAFTYISPEGTLPDTVYINGEAYTNKNGWCNNCSLYADFIATARGTVGIEVYVIDTENRRSNTMSTAFTVN